MKKVGIFGARQPWCITIIRASYPYHELVRFQTFHKWKETKTHAYIHNGKYIRSTVDSNSCLIRFGVHFFPSLELPVWKLVLKVNKNALQHQRVIKFVTWLLFFFVSLSTRFVLCTYWHGPKPYIHVTRRFFFSVSFGDYFEIFFFFLLKFWEVRCVVLVLMGGKLVGNVISCS